MWYTNTKRGERQEDIMLGFTYCTPTKVVFGNDALEQVGELIKSFGGTKVLIHYGGRSAVRKRNGRVLKRRD